MKDIFVIIPTLNPDEQLMLKFLKELHKEFSNIIVIDDGSNIEFNAFFSKLTKKKIIVLKHYKNLGKGRAIKNAFNYILNNYPNVFGAVVCDCDGQYLVNDIIKVAHEILENKDKLILGVRDFEDEKIPIKRRYSNIIMKQILKIFIGLDISDTQTGLRGFSKYIMYQFMDTVGERFDYETNMLILCKQSDIDIEEVPVSTVYINNHSGYHFRSLKDSLLIYRSFIKYFLCSFSSFLLDIIFFSFFLNLLDINSKILAATILARILSSIYNYIINSRLVFKNQSLNAWTRYYVFVIIIMLTSGCFVTYLSSLIKLPIIVIKIIVDSFLWIINIMVLREFVFKGKKDE